MCNIRESIKINLMTHTEVNQRKLADFLGISENKLSYQLNNSKQLADEIREKAPQFFADHGIQILLDDKSECEALMKAAMHLLNDKTAEMNLDQLYDAVLKAVDDDKLTSSEKNKLITVAERLRIATRKQNELRMMKVERDFDAIVNVLNCGAIYDNDKCSMVGV